MLVAFSGYARSGKDTAAAALVDELGFTRVAFADKLRDFLYRLNPVVDVEPYGSCIIRLQDVIDEHGWDGYKATVYATEIRELLQRLGTECGRQVISDSIWVAAALDNLAFNQHYVVTDCRFPNEAAAVKVRGGIVLRVERAGVGPANSHPSETSLDDYDFDGYVHNDGTIEEFQASVVRKVLEYARRG